MNVSSGNPDALRRILLQVPVLVAVAPLTAGAAMTYDWLPTECAPAAYPVFLVKGRLAFPDGGSIGIPDRRNVSNGWGQRGSTHIVGPARKPAPVQLELAWFSYVENKFFGGVFTLPGRAIADLMAIPVADTAIGLSAFSRIIVGMAPEGVVSVWAGATIEVVEVAPFQAPEVSLPWESVLSNPAISREEYVRTVLQQRLGNPALGQLSQSVIPPGLFQGYRKLYRWRPWVTGIGAPDRMQIRSFNGEHAVLTAAGPIVPRDLRPVPSQVSLVGGGLDAQPQLFATALAQTVEGVEDLLFVEGDFGKQTASAWLNPVIHAVSRAVLGDSTRIGCAGRGGSNSPRSWNTASIASCASSDNSSPRARCSSRYSVVYCSNCCLR